MIRHSHIILSALVLLLSACTTTVTPTIKIQPASSQMDYKGGQTTVYVSSNTFWTASCDVEGVTVEPASGFMSGIEPVVITVPESTSATTQTIRISFVAQEEGSSSKSNGKHWVTLASKPWIGFAETTGTIPAEGGGIRVRLESSRPWKVLSKSISQAEVSPAAADATTILAISLPRNDTGAQRELTVTCVLTEDASVKAAFTVTQPAL